jgi:hypothetical protein
MGLFEVNNTVTKLTTPPATDVEVSFGLAALVLLDKGDQASIKKLLKLREDVKKSLLQLDKLVEKAGAA